MTRWRSLIILIIVGSLGYTLLWFTYAHRLERRVANQFAGLLDYGLNASSENVEVTGFPYRLTVTLDGVSIESRSGHMAASADQARMISHLWSLDHWVMDFSGLSVSLDELVTVKAPVMTASWRQIENRGVRLILSTQDQPDLAISGTRTPVALASLGIDIPSEEARSLQPGLFAGAVARFGLGFEVADSRWRIAGDWIGPLLRDWTVEELNRWRDAGGLINIEAMDVRDDGGQTRAAGSLTLDENRRLLATFNTAEEASKTSETGQASALTELLLSLASEDVNPTGLMIVTVQNGGLMLNGTYAGDLKPVPAPSVPGSARQPAGDR